MSDAALVNRVIERRLYVGLADQFGHPQLGRGDAQQPGALRPVAQQQHRWPAQVGDAPAAVVEVVLVVEQVVVIVQFVERLIVGTDRVHHPELQKLTACQHLQLRQGLGQLDELQRRLGPGHMRVAHQGLHGLLLVKGELAAKRQLLECPQDGGVVRRQVAALGQAGQ